MGISWAAPPRASRVRSRGAAQFGSRQDEVTGIRPGDRRRRAGPRVAARPVRSLGRSPVIWLRPPHFSGWQGSNSFRSPAVSFRLRARPDAPAERPDRDGSTHQYPAHHDHRTERARAESSPRGQCGDIDGVVAARVDFDAARPGASPAIRDVPAPVALPPDVHPVVPVPEKIFGAQDRDKS